jgi:uncharacterized membrane protein
VNSDSAAAAGGGAFATVLHLIIPVVGVVFATYVAIKIGEAFGKTVGWSVIFRVILSLIGMLMLGFGSETYHEPVSGTI